MTLPGFDEDTGAVEEFDSNGLGLGGKASVVSGAPALVDLIRKGGVWVVLGLGFALVAMLVVSWWPRSATVSNAGTLAPLPTQPGPSSAEDSLGIKLSELSGRWNEAAVPPSINKGIPRTPEAGRFDAFTYRFNQSSLLAGAYDDRTEDLYALLASSWISDEHAHRLVIHLCHVAHPYSQACLDEYFEHGLGGKTLEDFRDVPHRAEWELDGIRWRLEISENIQNIRVIAPGGA